MGGGGGNPIVNAVSTVATAVASPVVATVGIAKEIAGADVVKKVDSLPVVGTVSQGITGAGQIYGDIATGNTQELKKDTVAAAKFGAVAGASYVGASLVGGASGVAGGVAVGEGIATKGLSVSTITGAAAAYLGNTVSDNLGVDLNQFLPKPGKDNYGGGQFDAGGGSVSDYFKAPKDLGSVPGENNTVTYILAGVAVFILIMAIKKRR